jgi:hypothetical protein
MLWRRQHRPRSILSGLSYVADFFCLEIRLISRSYLAGGARKQCHIHGDAGSDELDNIYVAIEGCAILYYLYTEHSIKAVGCSSTPAGECRARRNKTFTALAVYYSVRLMPMRTTWSYTQPYCADNAVRMFASSIKRP